MPVFTLDTNITISEPGVILAELTQLCSTTLGKPESYVMVHINDQQHLMFAGSTDALAKCSLASLGMSDENTGEYSAKICSYLESRLGIPPNRCYIEFKAPERSMFGWNNSTF